MSALPDRERRHLIQFYLVPRLGYGTRLGIAGGLVAVGVILQLLWASQDYGTTFAVTLPFVFAGNLFLLARGYNLAVENVSVYGEWKKTTRDRFQRARELEKDVRRWDETAIDGTCLIGGFTFVAMAFAAGAVWFWLRFITGQPYWSTVFIADAGVMLAPHWFTGLRRGWKPVSLRQEVDAVETALKAIETYEDPPCQLQPMFEMGGPDKTVPVGARAFVRFPDGPPDFLGIQFQVSINDVQGTKYPYLYAVVVAKKEFGLLAHYADAIRAKGAALNLTVETSSEDDVEVVVIRQFTTERSGYHTKDNAIRSIARFTWNCAAEILARAGAPV